MLENDLKANITGPKGERIIGGMLPKVGVGGTEFVKTEVMACLINWKFLEVIHTQSFN